MANMEELHQAQVNRSIRTIKAELEYLCDASIISPATLSDLLSRIPPQTAIHAPLSVGAVAPATQNAGKISSPQPSNPVPAPLNLPLRNNEKQNGSYYQPEPQQQPPPPAYNSPPPQASWPPLAQATALYAYTSTDAGDLELQPGDNITVTEYLNAEWWKGRSARTGMEGIFPRSYVKVNEEKKDYSNNYGNQPLEVSQVCYALNLFAGYCVGQAMLTVLDRWVMEKAQYRRRLKSKERSSARSKATLHLHSNTLRDHSLILHSQAGQRRNFWCWRNDWWQYRQLDLLDSGSVVSPTNIFAFKRYFARSSSSFRSLYCVRLKSLSCFIVLRTPLQFVHFRRVDAVPLRLRSLTLTESLMSLAVGS